MSIYEFSCSNAAAMLLKSLSTSKVMQLSFLQVRWMRDSEQKRQYVYFSPVLSLRLLPSCQNPSIFSDTLCYILIMCPL